MYRCTKDYFGYCHSKPNSELRDVEVTHIDYKGKAVIHTEQQEVCLNHPRTCTQYLTQTQLLALKRIASVGTKP